MTTRKKKRKAEKVEGAVTLVRPKLERDGWLCWDLSTDPRFSSRVGLKLPTVASEAEIRIGCVQESLLNASPKVILQHVRQNICDYVPRRAQAVARAVASVKAFVVLCWSLVHTDPPRWVREHPAFKG